MVTSMDVEYLHYSLTTCWGQMVFSAVLQQLFSCPLLRVRLAPCHEMVVHMFQVSFLNINKPENKVMLANTLSLAVVFIYLFLNFYNVVGKPFSGSYNACRFYSELLHTCKLFSQLS